jgi:hypothetical protein
MGRPIIIYYLIGLFGGAERNFKSFRRRTVYRLKISITVHYRAISFFDLLGVDVPNNIRILGCPNNHLCFA